LFFSLYLAGRDRRGLDDARKKRIACSRIRQDRNEREGLAPPLTRQPVAAHPGRCARTKEKARAEREPEIRGENDQYESSDQPMKLNRGRRAL